MVSLACSRTFGLPRDRANCPTDLPFPGCQPIVDRASIEEAKIG
ncbi:MAG: hypothetical protein SVX43_11925 [Cyanobacteriota bacterium]|nr:hypothetical protein [Cyanobacteriota bacterium]